MTTTERCRAPERVAALEAKRLTFGYDKSAPVLSGWSARFEPGETVALTGLSGRGKSTALYMLGLMLKPDDGTIELNGLDATGQSDRARAHLRASLFGFVFQDAALDSSRTVLDNVTEAALYRNQDRRDLRDRAEQLLSQMGVELDLDRKPGQVSGGQAQRIALCRALVGSPQILLADEPTGNLDRESSDVVVSALVGHAAQGGTVIIVTHDPAVAEQCDRSISL
jgi:ABC-type lipoprotein export system ATPase subunit